jgi:hypothetical protein
MTGQPIVRLVYWRGPDCRGFCGKLARPGGNVTGIVKLAPELDANRLGLLHDIVPGAQQIAALAVNVRWRGKSWPSHPAQLELE